MEKNLERWIDENMNSLTRDIIELVNIPSISVETGDPEKPYGEACRDALEKVREISQRMGFYVENHHNTCGTLLWKGETDSEIGIFGHLDVVPEGTGWSYEPYNAVVDRNCIIGRGAADNKGPSMAALYALKYLKETGWNPKHSLRFFFGLNEENGMKDIQYYIENHPMPAFSFTPDAAFPVCHGEKGIMTIDADYDIKFSNLKEFSSGVASNAVPSDAYAIVEGLDMNPGNALAGKDVHRVESCGNGSFKIIAKGIAAHAAFPDGSDSAEVKLAKILKDSNLMDDKARGLLNSIASIFGDYYGMGLGVPYEDDLSGKLTHIGGVARTSEGMFRQNINIRYPISADREKMTSQIRKVLQEGGFSIANITDSPPMHVDKNQTVVQVLTDISNKHLGTSLSPYVMGGGTYARRLKNAVGYGPGTPGSEDMFGPERGRGHQPDEYIGLDRLKKAIAIYAEAILAIDEIIGNE